ncbi:hypothetical protein IPC705_27990 [Pseudomonas aeruginosa]|nr:hypothetical protein [Pseudomonas aeruginosa]RPX68449.1 hypothetical protein IPC705_27990 [Pseudomonas aeruginosa]
MSLAIVHSRAQVGVEAPCVSVEAHLANGLPSLTLVGLPETAVNCCILKTNEYKQVVPTDAKGLLLRSIQLKKATTGRLYRTSTKTH